LAISRKTKDNSVANVVIEVEASASRGILSNELLSIMKLILVATANSMANMNFQFSARRTIFSMLSKFPEMSALSPRSTMDIVFVMQKIRSQKIPNTIKCVKQRLAYQYVKYMKQYHSTSNISNNIVFISSCV